MLIKLLLQYIKLLFQLIQIGSRHGERYFLKRWKQDAMARFVFDNAHIYQIENARLIDLNKPKTGNQFTYLLG
jgi:hypothetical protein